MTNAFKRVLPLFLASVIVSITTAAISGEVAPSTYVTPHMTHETFGHMKVVLPLTSADLVDMKLRNIGNALNAATQWGGSLDVSVVMYAKGVAWLKAPNDRQRAALDSLRAKGVRFLVCDKTLSENDIDFHTLYGVVDADIVPSGFAEVAYLQISKGFAVDPSF